DCITGDVSNALAHLGALRRVARTSACAYQNKSLSVCEIDEPPAAATLLLSLHDALPIYRGARHPRGVRDLLQRRGGVLAEHPLRSEEHTSELQSPYDLVCRPLLENDNDGRLAALRAFQPGERRTRLHGSHHRTGDQRARQ